VLKVERRKRLWHEYAMNTLALGYASVVFAILKITRPIDSILANKGRQKHAPLIGKHQNKHILFI
jgi:hypothetical protein